MLACPFHVPRYEWDNTAPLMQKCSMCFERLEQGELPGLRRGLPQRGDAVRRAGRAAGNGPTRGSDADPGRYLDRVWGENEFGGTSVLFVSDVDLASVGWPAQQTEPIPSLTDPLIHKTPLIGLSVALGCWGLSAIIQRRNQLMHGETELDERRYRRRRS